MIFRCSKYFIHLFQLGLCAFHNTILLYCLHFTIIRQNLFILLSYAKSIRCCNYNGVPTAKCPYIRYLTIAVFICSIPHTNEMYNEMCELHVWVCGMCVLVYVYERLCVFVCIRVCRRVCVCALYMWGKEQMHAYRSYKKICWNAKNNSG